MRGSSTLIIGEFIFDQVSEVTVLTIMLYWSIGSQELDYIEDEEIVFEKTRDLDVRSLT